MTALDNILNKIFLIKERNDTQYSASGLQLTLDPELATVELPKEVLSDLNFERNIRRYIQSAPAVDGDVFTALETFHSGVRTAEDRTILKWFIPQPRPHGAIQKVRFIEE